MLERGKREAQTKYRRDSMINRKHVCDNERRENEISVEKEKRLQAKQVKEIERRENKKNILWYVMMCPESHIGLAEGFTKTS